MKVTLNLTHRCNLACRYCYSGRALKEDMSLDTARKIVDFAMDITPEGKRIEFGFFGGEPLLRFDLMREITTYVRERARDGASPVCLSVTTNGTLLEQPILDFFRDENIHVCVSIDGQQHVHDLNRCYEDGRGSFVEVVKRLPNALEQLRDLQVNAVYGPDTIEFLPETVSFLADLGASAIHLNPDISARWPHDIHPKMRETYMSVAEYYIGCYRRGQEIAVSLLDSKVILFLKGGYTAEDLCGMGETEWGFAPSGNIYPCERFIGEDDDLSLCLGNIHTGLDLTRRCSLVKRRGNRNEECRVCALKRFCMNWCGCTNHFMSGRTDMAGTAMCANERAAIGAAEHVLVSLSGQEDHLFSDHFMRYLSTGRHYR